MGKLAIDSERNQQIVTWPCVSL